MRKTRDWLWLLLVVVLIPLPMRWAADRQERRNLESCRNNLKNIGTACEMYSTDNGGRFPMSLQPLTAYMRRIPTCPPAGRDTYSAGYAHSRNPDAYTLVCRGHNHVAVQANYPQYAWACDIER